jgi:hypothetical protein
MAQFVAIAGAVISLLSSFQKGRQARADGEFQAAQQEQAAGQDRAAVQRQAIDQRRQARLANSRLQALAAGSGNDPTVANLAADIADEGELRALTSLYQGEEHARGLEMGADSARIHGRNAQRAGMVDGIAQALQSGSSMYQRYGGGGFKGRAFKTFDTSGYNYADDASGLKFSASGAEVRGRR